MKLNSKSEWFVLDSPLGEPNIVWNKKNKYHIERVVKENGDTIWFGQDINWKKESGGCWTELSVNLDAKPLKHYLPEIVYGADRNYWKECDTPVYEKLYLELIKNN